MSLASGSPPGRGLSDPPTQASLLGEEPFKIPEVCLISQEPTSAAHCPSYCPAQHSSKPPSCKPFRYDLGLSLHVLQNPEHISCSLCDSPNLLLS